MSTYIRAVVAAEAIEDKQKAIEAWNRRYGDA